ncbi:GDP-L-fucose synthase, partial [Acinetobacter sp.]|uniref:GDP-L-fucose synthase family protein n=1 Tax=Acinetobacter sp. TaxID=472 RepID=UPI00258063E8
MDYLINKKDKIFIAGHLGMVGSAIHNLLKVKGYENILVASRKDLDLRTFSEVEKWFQSNKPDVVIIAAAKVGGIMANFKYPAEFILDNLKIQTNIIEIAYKFQVKKLLFLGSSCIYPKFAEQPIKEESLLSGFLEPTNEFYALAKITGIKLCNALRKQYGFDAISLMPTNLYGPGDNYSLENGHVIPTLIKKFHLAKISKKSVLCWGSGNPMREFLHVNDLANAILFVLENIQIKNNDIFLDSNGESLSFLNVGSGEEISIKELAKKISSVV